MSGTQLAIGSSPPAAAPAACTNPVCRPLPAATAHDSTGAQIVTTTPSSGCSSVNSPDICAFQCTWNTDTMTCRDRTCSERLSLANCLQNSTCTSVGTDGSQNFLCYVAGTCMPVALPIESCYRLAAGMRSAGGPAYLQSFQHDLHLVHRRATLLPYRCGMQAARFRSW